MVSHLVRVALAALSSLLLDGLWYSPLLFLKAWNQAAKISAVDEKHGPARLAIAYLGAFAAAWVVGSFLGPEPTLPAALLVSGELGLLVVGGSFAVNYSLGFKSFKLWAIVAGYHFVQFLLFGLIFGLSR